MAITGGARLPICHDEVFPSGALVMGVEPMLKFQSADDKARGVPAQPETDKISGLPMFAVTVIDQAAERKALQIGSGVPVMTLVRTAYDTDDVPVEVCDTVKVSHAYVLEYDVPAR